MSRLFAVLLGALGVLGMLGPQRALAALEFPWQPEAVFSFHWQLAPPAAGSHTGAYRLYDSAGNVIQAETRPLAKLKGPILIKSVPGVYTLEAWLQSESGERGPSSTATLRFDDVAPPAPVLTAPRGWIRGTDAAVLRIAPAAAPLPVSGISGYALSTDRGSATRPCPDPIHCKAEIDLADASGGPASLGPLPEGLNFVRAVAVSGAGVASPAATAELRVDATPPALSLQGAPTGWSARPVQLTTLASDPLSGMAKAGPLGPFTAISVDGGPAAMAPGGSATAWVAGSGTHAVEYFARDAAGNLSGEGAGAPGRGRALVRIDEEAPAVAFSAAQDPADPERIEASVSDALSGPSPDRGSIGVRPARTRARFEPLPTRVRGGTLVAHWDSDSYPPGKYEFLATGFDAAGNAGTGASRARGGRMLLVNPLKLPTTLATGFSAGRAGATSSRRARPGRRVRFGGILRTAAGPPAAGSEVAVTEVFSGASELLRRTTYARTGADGKFEVMLAPGPTREVVASFAGTRTLTRAAGAVARLEVPASVRMSASGRTARVGGAPVVFRGMVADTGLRAGAVRGLPVELQFRFRGSRWSEFRTVETDARGRFRYAYRFSDDDSRGVRFQFRAYVKGREGWPYEPGASRPVLVAGR
jgi:5-hydroxyisourate hydrolase-like protein (transthyretin family)